MDKKYYYIGDDGKEHGPISGADLLKLGNEKRNRGGSMVYSEDGGIAWNDFNETSGAIIAAASAAQSGEESPASFIQRVRGQTSYGTLRSVLAFFLVVIIIGIVIASGFCIYAASNMMRRSDMDGPIIVTLVVAVGLIIFTVALWQLFIMFVDMADTLIEQNRKKTK